MTEDDERDVRTMAYANKSALHYSVGTRECATATATEVCDMCYHAARLAVQYYRPVLTRRIVEKIGQMFGVRCTITHVGGD